MIEILGKIDEDILINLRKVEKEIFARFSLPNKAKFNLIFVSEKEIQKLNKATRQIDKVTDVLSYPYTNLRVGEKLNLDDYKFDIDLTDGTLTIGDIYICTSRAEEQAKEYDHSLTREICFLLCHGMLHCLGYDHIEDSDRVVMEEKQREIMDAVGIRREQFKCGFVTIVGDTNAGKSTLLNALVGEHVAIVSPKSQTTRENIQGIYNDSDTQIVFVDTPGYHKRSTLIDEEMDKQIDVATTDTEILLLLIQATKPLVSQYESIIKKVTSDAKKILVITKIDETSFEKLYPELAKLNGIAKVDEIVPVSAVKNKNVDVLIDLIKKYLPSYDHEFRYYPVEEYTDKNLRHMVAEIIREKCLLCLEDEIPHGVQVVVTDYIESAEPLEIYADLYCEKENHKSIILGKNGEMIKKISTMSRKSIEKIIDRHINLQIFVKTKPNWRNDEKAIAEFGLNVSE